MTRPTRPMLTVRLGAVAALTRQLAVECCARPGTREIGMQAAIAALTFCQLPLGPLRHQLAVHGRAAVHLTTGVFESVPVSRPPGLPKLKAAATPVVTWRYSVYLEVRAKPVHAVRNAPTRWPIMS